MTSLTKKWLGRKLAFSGEPTLEDRLVEMLQNLPLDIPAEKLRTFAKKCSGYRNDISHFGSARDPSERDSFIATLAIMNNALDALYHARLLQEIGVTDKYIQSIFKDHFKSFVLKFFLEAAGLIDKQPLADKDA